VWDDYRIAAVPGLVFLVIFGTGISCVWAAGSPVVSPHTTRILNYPFWISVVVLNVLTTSLISLRLLHVRRTLRKTLGHGHGKQYTTIVAMLVESAALELIFAILAFATFAANVTAANFFAPVEGLAVVIAPNLLIYRVARGSSFDRGDVKTLTTQPSLKFVSNPAASRTVQSPVLEKRLSEGSSRNGALGVSEGTNSTLVSFDAANIV